MDENDGMDRMDYSRRSPHQRKWAEKSPIAASAKPLKFRHSRGYGVAILHVNLSTPDPPPSDDACTLRAELAELMRRSLAHREQLDEVVQRVKEIAERISKLTPTQTKLKSDE